MADFRFYSKKDKGKQKGKFTALNFEFGVYQSMSI